MTIKQAFIGIVTAIALVIAVLISQIVRINTMTGDLQEAQIRIGGIGDQSRSNAKTHGYAGTEHRTDRDAGAGGLRGEPGQRVQRV